MLLSHVLSLEGRKRRGRRGINISSGSETGDFEGLIWIEVGQEKTASSVGGGTYCTRSTCIWILLSSLFASLEEREEAEGASRSPLGAKQGTLRD